MKKVLILLSCVLFGVSAINAQDSTKIARGKEKMSNMDSTHKQNFKKKGISNENLKELNLNQDQKKQIDEFHKQAKEEKEKVNNDNSLTAEQKKEKVKAIEHELKNKTNSVLTTEQKDKLKQQKAANKKNTDTSGK